MMRTRVMISVLIFAAVCVAESAAIKSRPDNLSGTQVSSAYALAGEFRTVAANLLWIKADRYHHEFVRGTPDWTKDEDLLGLIRIITQLDPRFIEAYASGAVMYAYGFNDPGRAVAYLEEGIRNNPKSSELYETEAIIRARRLNQPDRALSLARKAYACCDDPARCRNIRRLIRTLHGMAAEDSAHKQSEQNCP